MAKEYKENRDGSNRLLSYTRKKDGAVIPIDTENRDYRRVLKWINQGNTPDVDSDVLDKIKRAKRQQYRKEGAKRIASKVPEWDTYDKIRFIISIANLLDTGSMNNSQKKARDIYLYVKNTAIPAVNAKTEVGEVLAIDVVNDPNWP